jgi:hypothetical protein
LKGVYDSKGNRISPLVYQDIIFPYVDDVEGNSADFVIGIVEEKRDLINIRTKEIMNYVKPPKSKSNIIDFGTVAPNDSKTNVVTVKVPDPGIYENFPKINKVYDNIELAEILYFDESHFFKYFRVWKYGKMGYVGENGKEYFGN